MFARATGIVDLGSIFEKGWWQQAIWVEGFSIKYLEARMVDFDYGICFVGN